MNNSYSLYAAMFSHQPARLKRAEALGWLGDARGLRQFHAALTDEAPIRELIGEDED